MIQELLKKNGYATGAAVSAFVQQGGFDHSDSERDGEFPRLRTLRVGIHVSLGARQAVRSVGAALGMEPPRVNSVARQVPLLSSPGAIDNVMTHAPELGIPDAGAGVEPYNTLVRVAGQLEGLPHRYGAHPSAYTFSFYGPGALAWLPAQWVSAGRPGQRRGFGAARHLAVVAQERAQAAGLAHQAAVPANVQAPAGPLNPESDADGESRGSSDLTDNGGPVIALQFDKQDLESLGLERLDISPSAAMATASTLPFKLEEDAATTAAAWRLPEAGDTVSLGMTATLTLSDAHGRPLGGYLDYSGIRSITIKNGRLLLNGRLLHARGVDMQEQNVDSGGALSSGQTQALIGWARQLGATIIRTHYPVGPLMEELADRDGILIWSEVPAFGIPNVTLRQPSTQAQARQLLSKNVLENQNHPSIRKIGGAPRQSIRLESGHELCGVRLRAL